MLREVVLPLSTRSWNVIKFFLVEVLVSVVLSSTFVRVVKARVGALRADGHKVHLFESGLGRLTPYNLIWERVQGKPAHAESHNWSGLRRRSSVALFVVNSILLFLLVIAEFGSDSTRVHAQTATNGFGRESAKRLLDRDPSIRDYSKHRIVQPATNCIRQARESPADLRIIPFTKSAPECTNTEEHEVPSDAVSFSACAAHALENGVPECGAKQIAEALKFTPDGTDWRNEELAILVTGSRQLDKDSIELLGTDNPGGDYKIVEGTLKRGVRDKLTNESSGTWTGRASTVCLLSSFSSGSYVLPSAPKNNNWAVRSCMVYSLKSVIVFGVDHSLFNQGGGKPQGDLQQIENFRISKYSMLVMQSGSLTTRPHIGMLLALAGQCKISFGLDKAPLTLQRNVVEAFAKTNLYRLLGFVQQLGEYRVTVHLNERKDQATIDLRFMVPIIVLILVGVAQLVFACAFRNDENVIADLGSALELCEQNEVNRKNDQYL